MLSSLPCKAEKAVCSHNTCALAVHCRDVGKNLLVRVIIYMLFMLRQTAVGLQTVGVVGRWLAWPLRLVASMLQRPLNNVSMMLQQQHTVLWW